MQIVIPMSGLGSRFLAAGYTDPKPLIEVDGKPIIAHVISMFPGEKNFVFICNEKHLATTPMAKILKEYCPTGKVVAIPEHKLGPVYAVLCAKDEIDNSEATLVSYCDYFAWWDYKDFKQTVDKTQCDGAIPSYIGFHPHLLLPNLYAGVRVDSENYLEEIKEKFSFTSNKMDTWQSSGAYYYKTGAMMKKYFEMTIEEKLSCNSEYYVSLVYNLLKRDGLKTLVYEQKYFCQWGTPEDLAIYKNWSAYFRKLAGVS